MKKFFELVCQDLTSLGGRMGTEMTSDIFRRAFGTLKNAQKFAEKDHEKRDDHNEIRWKKDGRDQWYSGDLLGHDYTITAREIE